MLNATEPSIQQVAQPNPPSLSIRHCTPLRVSSYTATPFVQDEIIIKGILEITYSLTGIVSNTNKNVYMRRGLVDNSG